jgi:hypothetical protein
MKSRKININGVSITIQSEGFDDYISLTDMAKSPIQDVVIIKWLTVKSTIEYLGEWEALYNPDFNYTEFGVIEKDSGVNRFIMSVGQWIVNILRAIQPLRGCADGYPFPPPGL